MVLRFALLAAAVAATLAFVQQREVLKNAGLTGYCTTIATPRGQTGHWHACRPGKLTGTPELSKQSCSRAGRSGTVEFWRCETELAPNAARQ
ncbi:MAG TPA: hypothetical protein VE615_01045 [Gaiellaceae bacterium]|jgi:hypothetical protein|nr:hypothetical protein [Gaiellaceae bacterium]